MSYKIDGDLLDKAYVAKPCHASWDAMTGDEQSRLCGRCDRRVYNIEAMTRRDALDLIANTEGRLCVRMYRRPDGRVMTCDCPKGLTEYRKRIARMAGVALAAVIGLFSTAYGQRSHRGDSAGTRSETFVEIPIVDGTVRDQTGAVIENAVVTIGPDSGPKVKRKTDKNGYFFFTSSKMIGRVNVLQIESPGFQTFGQEFTVTRREQLTFAIDLRVGAFTGVVFTDDRAPLIDVKSSGVSTTIIVD